MARLKLECKKEKHLIYIKKGEEVRRFNLKSNTLQKPTKMTDYISGEKVWKDVGQDYIFFQYYNFNDLTFEDEKFNQLMNICRRVNSNCKSLSTFLTRLNGVMHLEGYIQEGCFSEEMLTYNYRHNYKRMVAIKQPLNFYPKKVSNFIRNEERIKFTREFEIFCEGNMQLAESLIDTINLPEFRDNKVEIFNLLSSSSDNRIMELLNDYKYNLKALLGFIYNYLEPFENLQPYDSIRLLRDYYNMAQTIGRKVKKYPKYLKSMHDIITANYNAYKQEYDELKFKELSKPELELEGKQFCMVIPNETKDIISEGTDLNHCVSSYVEKVIKGEVYIMFLRLTKNKDSSLVTIEVIGNKITQAKGSYNRTLLKEEKTFLEKYCKNKKLICEV